MRDEELTWNSYLFLLSFIQVSTGWMRLSPDMASQEMQLLRGARDAWPGGALISGEIRCGLDSVECDELRTSKYLIP